MKLTYVLGPESLLAVFTGAIFWIAARHPSGQGRDVEILERLVMLVPLLTVALAFTTIFVPEAKTWWWLGRMLVASFAAMFICAWRLIEGFGDGAKGQDAAFFLVLAFGIAAASLASSAGGAMILAETRPSFAEWFAARRYVGSFLTMLSAVPIGVALGVTLSFGLGIVGGIWTAFK